MYGRLQTGGPPATRTVTVKMTQEEEVKIMNLHRKRLEVEVPITTRPMTATVRTTIVAVVVVEEEAATAWIRIQPVEETQRAQVAVYRTGPRTGRSAKKSKTDHRIL